MAKLLLWFTPRRVKDRAARWNADVRVLVGVLQRAARSFTRLGGEPQRSEPCRSRRRAFARSTALSRAAACVRARRARSPAPRRRCAEAGAAVRRGVVDRRRPVRRGRSGEACAAVARSRGAEGHGRLLRLARRRARIAPRAAKIRRERERSRVSARHDPRAWASRRAKGERP